ncbi:leucine Rich repeat-containing domain protein [Ostertagia ostertagi]
MWLSIAAILGIALLTESFQKCPNGCDCLPDPLVESSFSYLCRWSSLPSDFRFSNSSLMRSIQIVCEDSFALPDGLFGAVGSLQHLSIEACRSRELSTALLSPLTNLRSLNLHEMALVDKTFSVSDEALEPLKRLEKLSITNSHLLHLPEKLLCNLKNLQVLNVSTNWISNLPFADASCVANQLIIVDFSYNRLESLGAELHVLPSVRQLSLSHNRLSSIEKDSLLKCPLLQQLELNNNFLEDIQSLPGFPFTVVRKFNGFNGASSSRKQYDHGFEAVRAGELYSSSNGQVASLQQRKPVISAKCVIEMVAGWQIILTPLLDWSSEMLNLVSNRLERLRDDVFAALHELSSLGLANNSIELLEPAVFADLAIGEIDLSHNRLTEVPIAIARLFKLKKIDLSHNKIKKLPQFVFNKISHLHNIDLNHNELSSVSIRARKMQIRLASLADALAQASAVRRLDVSRNHLELLQWSELPPRLEHLIADSNIITLLGAALKSKVRTVSLRGNRIEQLSADQIPDTIETLDLTANRIQHVAPATFASKTAMRSLDLSDNHLTELSEESVVADGVHSIDVKRKVNVVGMSETLCMHPVNGKVIALDAVDTKDLLCNYSQILPQQMTSGMSQALMSSGVRSLSLSGNAFRCDCNMDRVRCVENITEAFRNNDTTVLSAYPPNVGNDIFTMTMDGEYLMYLESLERYKASSSLNCSSTPGSSPLPIPLLNFDAFVSYSKKDEKIPLEDEEYALCLLHRDGPAYNSRLHAISDELISQMEAAQCLVIVLTKNFLESEWKTLQVKTSHQLFAKNRGKRVIAILGEGVDQNLLDEELGQILRKNTCIRQKDHLFWQLLHSALPTRLASLPGSGDDGSQIYSDMYGIVPSAVI